MRDPEAPAQRPSPPPRPRRSAAHVEPAQVQHPTDREALAAVARVPGMDQLVRLIFEKGIEKVLRLQNLSSAVRVGPTQFPELHARHLATAARLGVDPAPPLYVRAGPLNAFTSGVEEPFIVVTSSMVNMTTPDELDFVIGHELGHIRCGHVLYNTVAQNLRLLSSAIPVVGQLLSAGLGVALLEWSRKAELSCDRYGWLAVQDAEPGLRTMVKLAGAPFALYDQLSVDAFLAQYQDFERLDRDALSFFYRLAAESQMTHPWLVERAFLLRAWVESGEAARLLAGAPLEGEADAVGPRALDARRCPSCGALAEPADAFCTACGVALRSRAG